MHPATHRAFTGVEFEVFVVRLEFLAFVFIEIQIDILCSDDGILLFFLSFEDLSDGRCMSLTHLGLFSHVHLNKVLSILSWVVFIMRETFFQVNLKLNLVLAFVRTGGLMDGWQKIGELLGLLRMELLLGPRTGDGANSILLALSRAHHVRDIQVLFAPGVVYPVQSVVQVLN